MALLIVWFDASAGEGRSEKIMLKESGLRLPTRAGAFQILLVFFVLPRRAPP
jgi:hypothetical protein